jgi:hypothetical protein
VLVIISALLAEQTPAEIAAIDVSADGSVIAVSYFGNVSYFQVHLCLCVCVFLRTRAHYCMHFGGSVTRVVQPAFMGVLVLDGETGQEKTDASWIG